MALFLSFAFSIVMAALAVLYVLIWIGKVPAFLSVIFSILSVRHYSDTCYSNNEAKKIKLYNIRDFFTLIFLNIVLLPYINNTLVRYFVLIGVFVIGLILTIVIMKIDNKLIKKARELGLYLKNTLLIGVIFEIGRIVCPMIYTYLQKNNISIFDKISEYSFIVDILIIGTLIISLVKSIINKRKNRKENDFEQ